MDIGSRIRYFREKKGITVNKLANLSGISQSYLRDIELGNKQPTVEYLSYVCDALGVSLERFFSDEEKKNDLLREIDILTDEQRDLLLKFLKSFN